MTTRKLEKSEWESYFDELSAALGPRQVEIQVDSLALGAQIAAEWVQLTGLSYDPRSNTLDVLTEALDHRIQAPREIYVQETDEGLASIEAVDHDGNKRIIKLKGPLLLTA